MAYLSNYIEVIPYNGSWILWNKLNGSLVQLEQEKLLECNNKFQVVAKEPDIINYLDEHLFFIQDKYVQDEIRKHAKPYEDYEDINVVISVTEKCNCECRYCYQSEWRNSESISESKYFEIIMKYFSDLVDKMPPTNGKITLRFFGGEPLLKIDFILAITKKLAHLALISEKNIKTIYQIDSNCLLLTKETIERFDNLSISTTLTLPNDHNNLRSHSFEKTLSNLVGAKELFELPNYNLNINYNVHHDNVDSFELFLKMIQKNGLRCNVYTTNIVNYTGGTFFNKLSDTEYGRIYREKFVPLLIQYGYAVDDYLPAYGYERNCRALNLLNRKFYSDGSITPCSFFDKFGKPIRFSTTQKDIFHLPDMCIKCYDFPYCGGKKPCVECDGKYKYRDEMRERLISYVTERTQKN